MSIMDDIREALSDGEWVSDRMLYVLLESRISPDAANRRFRLDRPQWAYKPHHERIAIGRLRLMQCKTSALVASGHILGRGQGSSREYKIAIKGQEHMTKRKETRDAASARASANACEQCQRSTDGGGGDLGR